MLRIQYKDTLLLKGMVFAVLLGLSACGGGNSSEHVPDVSRVKVDLQTRRFDRDFISIDSNHISAGLEHLYGSYPEFLDFYLDTILAIGVMHHYTDSSVAVSRGVRSFLTYPDYRNLFDTIAVHYPDTKKTDEDLLKGFQYMQHYYPEFKIPRVIYFNSFLANWGVVSYEGGIAIGLDMFLGRNFPFYTSVGQPDYMLINFRPESIVPSVFNTIYFDFHPFRDEERTLLDMMIQKGKQQYFLEKMLPFVQPEDRIGYTADQLKWCEANEAMIYNFFAANNLLFEKNWSKMRRYVVYGPTTNGMPAESPGNIGTWLGYRIVKAFAKEHPEMTPEQIFATEQADQFLKQSKYKPK
ncbi:hypothetical protein [Rurimicrobium arvi]|uniref:Gliding motility lipoprotein GldB n=1 Tax=Rurimicrobium arvi TaxID=2049916 RepID=A0ABP8MSY4_9BACT